MTPISVNDILHSKAPALARRLPRGVVRMVERTIRQDEINHILTTHGDKGPMEFLRAFFDYAGVTYETVGLDALPADGRYVFASNHPFGGMDGMMLAERIGSHFGDVRVVVNDMLMYLSPLRPIFVPVNTSGAQRGSYAVAFAEAFSGEAPVLTFPAGLCSRRGRDGAVRDVEWRPSFIKRAEQTGRLIVPVYVEGGLSNRFYRWARWRKLLGVKANIEQIFLPDEMLRQRGSHFRLIFGEPISVDRLRAEAAAGVRTAAVREGMGNAETAGGAKNGGLKAGGAVNDLTTGTVRRGGDYPAMAARVREMSYALAPRRNPGAESRR